jgi:hypothetical protein
MRLRRFFSAAVLAGIFLAACQAPGTGAGGQAQSGKIVQPRENDPAVNWSDPCASNLVGITEVMLLYYSVHHHLPTTLEELPQKNLASEPLVLACPVSHQRYQYFPDGYHAPADLIPSGMRLILYDPEPAHILSQKVTDGHYDYDWKRPVRYGIVMLPPTPNHSIQMYVVPLEQNLLDLYLKSVQKTTITEIPHQ